jgi:hypothetical protein
MAAPTIPAANTQAVQSTGGGTIPFTVQWWNFFNSLIAYVTTGPFGPVPIAGVTDGSSAASGIVGEYKSSFVLVGSAVNLPDDTDTQITSLALTAGDWDLSGETFFVSTGATVDGVRSAINTTVNSLPAVPADGVDLVRINGISFVGTTYSINGLRTRVSITTPKTYLLISFVDFSGGSVVGYGGLRARRMR